MSSTPNTDTIAWCPTCETEHHLPAAPALPAARRLMDALEGHRRLDFEVPAAEADPRLGTDYLFGPARGQMFGVLVAEDGSELKAFSGLYNAVWDVPGWAPHLLPLQARQEILFPSDGPINELGRQMKALAKDDPRYQELKAERRSLSRETMRRLHGSYTLLNFHGATSDLPPFYTEAAGPPTGAGDCCAPKLLAEAARRGLRPVGMTEFFFGQTNASGSRQHGGLYAPCLDKCAPILGWMMCGGAG